MRRRHSKVLSSTFFGLFSLELLNLYIRCLCLDSYCKVEGGREYNTLHILYMHKWTVSHLLQLLCCCASFCCHLIASSCGTAVAAAHQLLVFQQAAFRSTAASCAGLQISVVLPSVNVFSSQHSN
jgi:hypothetical protein